MRIALPGSGSPKCRKTAEVVRRADGQGWISGKVPTVEEAKVLLSHGGTA